MSSAAKASGNAAQTPKAVSPLANFSLSDLAVFIRLPPLRVRKHVAAGESALQGSSVLRIPPSDEYVVGDGVPGVVDADEEQEQCRSSDAKQSLAGMRESRKRR